jgi:integrase
MAGQIIKRGEQRYLIRIFLGRHPTTGKRRYRNETVQGSKKKAEARLTQLLRERDTGTLIEPTRVTVDHYLDDWLQSAARPRLRQSTYDGYELILKLYVRPELGDRPLASIQPLDIQGLYAGMIERGLSPRTVRHAHAVLRSALNQAVKWRLLHNNAAMFVDLPRQQKKEMHALSPEQAQAFLKTAADDKWGVLFALALTTGMRPGEYLGLQWKDVDLTKGIATVRRAVAFRSGGEWEFTEPKTAKSVRPIPLPPSVTAMLVAHQTKQAEKVAAARQRREDKGEPFEYTDHGLVFAGDQGQPLDLRNLTQRHFRAILKAAELPQELRLYDLRHSCATLLLAQGEHPKVVSERLGHASVTLTLDTYSHVLPTMQQQAAERLETALFGRE